MENLHKVPKKKIVRLFHFMLSYQHSIIMSVLCCRSFVRRWKWFRRYSSTCDFDDWMHDLTQKFGMWSNLKLIFFVLTRAKFSRIWSCKSQITCSWVDLLSVDSIEFFITVSDVRSRFQNVCKNLRIMQRKISHKINLLSSTSSRVLKSSTKLST